MADASDVASPTEKSCLSAKESGSLSSVIDLVGLFDASTPAVDSGSLDFSGVSSLSESLITISSMGI